MAHGLQGFPQASYYGKSNKASTPAPKAAPAKKLETFEDEYQKFINQLKDKKEAKQEEPVAPVIPETPVEEPKEIIPETVTTVEETAPILNETTTPKKSRKKKTEVVEETTPVEE